MNIKTFPLYIKLGIGILFLLVFFNSKAETTFTKSVGSYEPCTDPTGVDTDGDGINDVCDLDNDNDGILDEDECFRSSSLVGNGDFTSWIFYTDANNPGWTGSGNQWNKDADRAWFPQWNGTGTASFYQTINVSSGSENSITFDVGANTSYNNQVVLNVLIDGATVLSETSNQIAVTNGGQSQNGNATLNMVSRTIVFTPTSSTIVLRFNGVSTSGNHDMMYIDNVILTTGCSDFDNDGVLNIHDLDSDNDGIYDTVEAGHNQTHSNGVLIGDVGTDGIPNSVQSSPNNGTVNYTVLNSENEGNKDFIDLDSDGDGCNDVIESGFTQNSTKSGELQGSGYNATTGKVTGNLDGYTTPIDNNSNNIYDYREAGTIPIITTQPQDKFVSEGSNVIYMVATSASDNTYEWQISTNDGVTFSSISGANGASYSINGVSNSQDKNLYRVLVSDSSFKCTPAISSAAILRIVLDSDNDGVVDTDDRDDDNDGILDAIEATNCGPGAATVNVVIFSEDFGIASGSRISTPYTNYIFENGSNDLQDGYYTIFEDISSTASWAPSLWQSRGDHTSGSDRMAIFNANNTAGREFYRRTLVQVEPDVPLDISFWVMNLDVDQDNNDGRIEPDITALIQQNGATVFSFESGSIPREANGSADAWKNFIGSFTPTSTTALELVLINNAPGGLGNDLALDDIQIVQSFCDSDNNGIPNTLEADSDGDGCTDSDEAYANRDADLDNNGKYGSGAPIVNSDGTVVAASYQTPHDGNLNGIYDYAEAYTVVAITQQPLNQYTIIGDDAIFSVTATGGTSGNLDYQWQQSLDDGATFTNISGATSSSYTVSNVSTADHKKQFRVLVYDSAYICTDEYSNEVILFVDEDTDADGILNILDFDDDNDGILDVDEGCGNLIINSSFEQQDFTDPATFPDGFTDGSGTFIGATYNTNELAGWNYTTNLDGWVGGGSPSWTPDVYAPAYHGN
ncbi:Thrombospondin type 3 repeat-containing protein [Cellulophaga algicola DSM 14237]|uniref:Thrombospondin type 3 repeat-containing protein n=1 Tax=Cellulophaga algicola (strain DSM 14237 / IC166 / ACAM 630) TaxID=688270 RepID=E6X850_CELAD|nr:thrombospondin type 3 repeat-containing protein [Cellulophaga algicola]ADV49676.1 Thrombospondin type 3 repeat-containing protein [Cellulophaga algicola DSM 14237]